MLVFDMFINFMKINKVKNDLQGVWYYENVSLDLLFKF